VKCLPAERSPKDLLELSAEAQLRRQAAEIEFCAALCSLTILRYAVVPMPSGPISKQILQAKSVSTF